MMVRKVWREEKAGGWVYIEGLGKMKRDRAGEIEMKVR